MTNKMRRNSPLKPRRIPKPISLDLPSTQCIGIEKVEDKQKKESPEELIQGNKEWDACQVSDSLWVGSHSDALNDRKLIEMNIGLVINCTKECENSNALPPSINVIKLFYKDHSDAQISASFLHLAKRIAIAWSQGKGVFIHCQQGISRAPTTTIAMLMILLGLDYEKAFAQVRACRSKINPNLGFLLILIKLDKVSTNIPHVDVSSLRESSAKWLVDFEQWCQEGGVDYYNSQMEVQTIEHDLCSPNSPRTRACHFAFDDVI